MQITTLIRARAVTRPAQKDASKAHQLLDATFGLVSGQFSIGHTPKHQRITKIASDGAWETTQEKTVFGR